MRMGAIRSAGCSTLSLAVQQKFFEQQNMQVDLTFMTWADAQAGAKKNKFDVFCSNLAELVLLPADYRIVAIPSYSNGADVLIARKDAGVDLNGLKGARIGVPPTSMGELLLTQALMQSALVREDFTVLPEEAAELRESIQKSEIQMAVAAPPQAFEILQNPEMQVIFQSSAMPGDIIDTVAVSALFLQKHPDMATQLDNVWRDTAHFIEHNPSEAINFLAQASALPLATLQRDYKFLTRTEQAAYHQQGGRLFSLIDQLQAIFLQAGSLKIKRETSQFLAFPPQGSESDP